MGAIARVVLPSGGRDVFTWEHVLTLPLDAGEHELRARIPRHAGVDLLRATPRRSQDVDYLAVLRELGMHVSAAEALVTHGDALASLSSSVFVELANGFQQRIEGDPSDRSIVLVDPTPEADLDRAAALAAAALRAVSAMRRARRALPLAGARRRAGARLPARQAGAEGKPGRVLVQPLGERRDRRRRRSVPHRLEQEVELRRLGAAARRARLPDRDPRSRRRSGRRRAALRRLLLEARRRVLAHERPRPGGSAARPHVPGRERLRARPRRARPAAGSGHQHGADEPHRHGAALLAGAAGRARDLLRRARHPLLLGQLQRGRSGQRRDGDPRRQLPRRLLGRHRLRRVSGAARDAHGGLRARARPATARFDDSPRSDNLDYSLLVGLHSQRFRNAEIDLAGGYGQIRFDSLGTQPRIVGRGEPALPAPERLDLAPRREPSDERGSARQLGARDHRQHRRREALRGRAHRRGREPLPHPLRQRLPGARARISSAAPRCRCAGS